MWREAFVAFVQSLARRDWGNTEVIRISDLRVLSQDFLNTENKWWPFDSDVLLICYTKNILNFGRENWSENTIWDDHVYL
jgi:hypothetical protein